MDNPDDEKTVINVKGMSLRAWEKAKRAASKQDQTMGAWLSRAVDHLANLEDGPREFAPVQPANLEPKSGNPSSLPIEQLGLLMQGLAALSTATGTAPAKGNLRRLYTLADDHVREASGSPARPVRVRTSGKAFGQSRLLQGKADQDGV